MDESLYAPARDVGGPIHTAPYVYDYLAPSGPKASPKVQAYRTNVSFGATDLETLANSPDPDPKPDGMLGLAILAIGAVLAVNIAFGGKRAGTA